MPYAYILHCAGGSYYVGSTIDLERRVAEHQAGEGAQYTTRRRPVELVWAYETQLVDDAFAIEKKVQGWSRAKREALIDGRLGDLPGLSGSAYRRRGLDTRPAGATRPPSDDLDTRPAGATRPPSDDLDTRPAGATRPPRGGVGT
jgi:putative endonuclease